MTQRITHLVFDLGGVIVELNGTPILDAWISGETTSELLWRKWLTSESPRSFESGLIGVDEFAEKIVRELSLGVSKEQFIEHFAGLPIGPYPGALELLHSLKNRYTTSLFSNSNVLHWERKMNEMKLDDAFHHKFASHLMGKVKPDLDAFQEVERKLGVPSSQILFLDDNQLNVDAAKSVGFIASRVVGFNSLKDVLKERGIS
ncbi:HAD family hydrolase [Granulosicoccus sp. 3-233]|uniref:HAD family hydrolase n=1 Tax=Granulosicoccus sp. 3-233 TaxID=3417969 RepID=UPI003D34A131